MVNIEIKNLREIRMAFSRSPQLMTKNLNIAIRRSIFEIGRDSRINTPVDTGRLRASTYETFTTLRGEVGTKTEYDLFVHEGTRFQRSQPYLRKSVEKNQRNVDSYFADAVQVTLNEIGKMT